MRPPGVLRGRKSATCPDSGAGTRPSTVVSASGPHPRDGVASRTAHPTAHRVAGELAGSPSTTASCARRVRRSAPFAGRPKSCSRTDSASPSACARWSVPDGPSRPACGVSPRRTDPALDLHDQQAAARPMESRRDRWSRARPTPSRDLGTHLPVPAAEATGEPLGDTCVFRVQQSVRLGAAAHHQDPHVRIDSLRDAAQRADRQPFQVASFDERDERLAHPRRGGDIGLAQTGAPPKGPDRRPCPSVHRDDDGGRFLSPTWPSDGKSRA